MVRSMKIKHERDLDQIAPMDPNAYDSMSLAALVVYSLYWLHEWELRRTIEAITVLSWRLFPTKFSMSCELLGVSSEGFRIAQFPAASAPTNGAKRS